MLRMMIGDTAVAVDWENNESVEALKNLCAETPLVIQMSMYGGFEQVGPVGTRLPSSDVQTRTSAGDIVLYSSSQIVVFYGSNSWAYTRLGHITDRDPAGMAALLGNVLEDVTKEECPVIGKIEEVMKANGALGAIMSGSGPTVFGLFENETEAKNAYERLKAERLAKQIYLTGFFRRKHRRLVVSCVHFQSISPVSLSRWVLHQRHPPSDKQLT